MFQTQIKSRIGEDICLLIRPDNHAWNYLCECGDASDLSVKEVQNSAAVFLSHTHIDHFVNFDAVIRHQIGIQRRVIICGPAGIGRHVQAKLHAYTWNLIAPDAIVYEIREMISEENILLYELLPPKWELTPIGQLNGNLLLEDKSFSVSGILLDHKTPSLAYRFKEQDTVSIDLGGSSFKGGKWVRELKAAYEAGEGNRQIQIADQSFRSEELFHLLKVKIGDSVGVIMDHAAHPENHTKIIEHFSGCEKVFIECFYKAEDKEFAATNFHSYSSMSGKVMREAGVKEAIPVHFSRKYQEEEIADLRQEFEVAWKG